MTEQLGHLLGGAIVSRETIEKLRLYDSLLKKWNQAINLVSKTTLEDAWNRHFLDSAQLISLAPKDAKTWLDVGSGAGFPGAVIGIIAEELRPGLRVTLVEADQRKSTFLKTVARETGVDLTVCSCRYEMLEPHKSDVVSARALAPLKDLLWMADRHLREGGIAIFPKGIAAQKEIAEARKTWCFRADIHHSRIDDKSVVLTVGDISRV